MPGFQLLTPKADSVYRYDGSLAGFYCCVYACVYDRECPMEILSASEPQTTLFLPRPIDTDRAKALRVREAVAKKISPRALELCENVFLTPMPQKESAMARFLLRGFQEGPSLPNHLTDPLVSSLLKAEKHLLGEAHLLCGFVRFADHQGNLVAAISPKNFVLPLLAPHFADRYSQETFLIHDRTHQVALFYRDGQARLLDVDNALSLTPSETELSYQRLWKGFCDTVAVPGRENPRCRMTHMPKRYWDNMLEMHGVP